MYQDEQGLPLTVSDAASATRFTDAMNHYLSYRADTADCLEAAITADPLAVLPRVLKGYLAVLASNSTFLPRARECLAAADANKLGATWREIQHVEALRSWLIGDLRGVVARLEAILARDPRDLLAIKLVHFHAFWLGDGRELWSALDRVLPAWDQTVPGYGYLLGMKAFGLEESGDYASAESLGRMAFALNPGDLWAAHAVSHVLEGTGRNRDGLAWIDEIEPSFAGCNAFVRHMWWHKAMHHFELSEFDAALVLYDTAIRRDPSDFFLDLQNAISLLWRLDLMNVPIGDRWRSLGEVASRRLNDLALPFTDIHLVMALAASGSAETAQRIVAAMQDYVASRTTTHSAVIQAVALPVAQSLLEFRSARWVDAAARLLQVHPELGRLGASRLQRDVLVQTMIEAALRGGRRAEAHSLLAESVSRWPASAWRRAALARASQSTA